MKKNKNETEISDVTYRLVASASYYLGITELIRKRSVSKGALPWRIIRYQRVVNPEFLSYPVPRHCFVRPKTFEKQLSYLRSHCHVVSLQELLSKIANDEPIQEKTVALTFDGGYSEHYTTVFPLLAKYGMPATMLLATAFIGSNTAFWSDKIALALLKLQKFQGTFPSFSFLPDKFFEELQELSPEGEISLPGIALFIEALREVKAEDRLYALAFFGKQLESVGGVDIPQMFISWEQVKEMAKAKVSFGSLGHGHTIASDFLKEEFASDLRQSYLAFTEHQIEPIKAFAFPEGLITQESLQWAEDCRVPYVLSIDTASVIKPGEGETSLLGRVSMVEALSYCPELFFARLWNVYAFGIYY